MSNPAVRNVVLASLAVLAIAAPPLAAQVCGPDPDGRVAVADYRETTIFWEPVVEYERIVLTVSGPCEDIVREFRRGETIAFDVREIERVQDGSYTWEIRRVPTIDLSTRKALAEARANGDDSIWWTLFQKGAIPDGPYIDSESFRVIRGVIVPPGGKEEGAQSAVQAAGHGDVTEPGHSGPRQVGIFASLGRSAPADSPLTKVTAADQVIPDDLIVQGSLCVGFDCVNNENFSFDTIRLKENNLRIKFDDTSVIAGFPPNDWQLTANDSASGGASKFSIEDISGARVPFTVRAGAPNNSIFVDSAGRVGLRTATPVLDLHINTSNTPGIRLEQNSGGGFTAQTWDIAGNEANFFVRDVTGGSRLPFRIRPGAPTSSVDISADGDTGVGTASPNAKLHVAGSDGGTDLLVEETNGAAATRTLITARNNGQTRFLIHNTNAGLPAAGGYFFAHFDNGNFFIRPNGGGQGLALDPTGNVTTEANLTVNGIFSNPSSRTLKKDFEAVDPQAVLARFVELPIAKWTYKNDADRRRHVGPTAEDFQSAFGLGSDGKYIFPMDVQGITMAALQGLHQQLQEKNAQIDELQRQINELRSIIAGTQERP